ncbi:MAG: HD domain-containing phosphohydrolase, partial [Endomicrobiia bacterium]
NDERNNIFISNILKEDTPLITTTNTKVRTIEEILKQSKEVKIVVTGGYHSEELSKILNDKNINTIVITPNIKGKIEQASKKYNEIVKEQNKIKSQALAFRLVSCSTEKDQRVLLAKVAMDLLGTMDINQAKQKLQEYGLKVEDINLTQEDINNQKQQTDSQITKIGSLIGKIINLIVAPEIMLNPRETIDTALIAMFEILVIQGIYFSKGFSPFIEEAGFIKKQTLFQNFDAVILSRLPVAIQQSISDTNVPDLRKKASRLSKIETALRKDLKDIAAEMRKRAERNQTIKKPTLLDKIIFEFVSSKYQLESINEQIKGIESAITIQKIDLEDIEIEPIQQINDIKQQEKAINDTVKQLEIFGPKLEALSQLEITIEEIKLQMAILQSKSFDKKTQDQLKVTIDRLENAEQNFNLLVNTFLTSLTKIYTDENTRQHVMKVAQYTQAITRYIPADLKKQYAPHFEYYSIIAALLHDIGKNAIPDSVLNKQDNLNDEEFEMIKTHAALGAEILNLSSFKIFAFGAQYHQERYNGQGYPNQLEDGQIPFIATIIALADSYDAMISKRVYKDELYRYIAIGRIKHDEGIYFNPIAVEAFMKAVNNGEFTPLRKGEIDYLLEASVDNSNVEILPENFEIVKESIQKGQGVWETAFRVAIKEIPNTLSTRSKDKSKIKAAKPRFRDIPNIVKNWLILTWRIPKLSEKLGKIIKNIIAVETSIVKHIVIDYKYVKSTGLQETIKKFGNNVTVDEKGQVHIPPILIVEDIEEIPAEERKNTGLKIKGKTIWQVETKGILVYGAKGALLEDVSKTLGVDVIKEELEKNFRKEGHKINLVVDTIMASNTQKERIVFEKNITTLRTDEIQRRNSKEQSEYIGSVLEIRSAIAVSQGEKIIVSLEKIEDKELLLQKIKNGKSRKIITVGQYEKLKSKNENIDQELMNLRKEGIEIYIQFSNEQINRDYRQKGFSGYIVGDKLTDYYSGDTINIKLIDNSDTVTLKYLEEMMTSSQEPLVVNIDILEKVFKQNRDILDSYDMLNLLIGSIETTFKIGNLSPLDAKEMVYNMNFTKIPDISKEKRQELANLTDEELTDIYNIKSILELSGSDVISITMQELENVEETKKMFMKTMRERILAKSMLQENNKNYGLKDRELEILLGKSIVKQFKNNDKKTTDISDEFIGNETNMLMFINKLQSDVEIINTELIIESDKIKLVELQQKKEIAINTTIELILVFADDNKFKIINKVESTNDAKNYRSMLSAA